MIPLFVSKRLAERATDIILQTAPCEVRGLNQQSLMALLPFASLHGFGFVCFFTPPPPDSGPIGWHGFPYSPEDLAHLYLVNHSELTIKHILSAREVNRSRK